MSIVFIWRSTATGARSTARTAARNVVLSGISTNKDRCVSPRRLANATTSRAAATTTHRASIFGITPKRCLIMTAVLGKCFARPLSTSDRHRLSPLISHRPLSRRVCPTMIRIRCICISAACSARRRQCGCSISTVSVHQQSGAVRLSSGRRTNREKSARVRLCCTIPRLVAVSRNRRPVSVGHTRNSACRTSRQEWMLQCPDCRGIARTKCYPAARSRSNRCVAGKVADASVHMP